MWFGWFPYEISDVLRFNSVHCDVTFNGVNNKKMFDGKFWLYNITEEN